MADFETETAGKASGAMLAIGELADRIGVPTHVLRYWETEFPNLKPVKLAGTLSEGMILCAEDADGKLALMTPEAEKDIADGAKIC